MKVYRQLFTTSLLLPASMLFACAQMGDSSTTDDVADDPGAGIITDSVA